MSFSFGSFLRKELRGTDKQAAGVQSPSPKPKQNALFFCFSSFLRKEEKSAHAGEGSSWARNGFI